MKSRKTLLIYILSAVIVTIILAIVAVVLIYNNILSRAEAYKQEVLAKLVQWEEHQEELERIRLEIIKLQKEKTVREIIEFYEKYDDLRKQYFNSIQVYESDIQEKASSVEELKQKVRERLVAANDFKNQMEKVDYIPGPMQDFFDLNIDYLDNEIQVMYYLIAYYGGFNYSTYNDTELLQLMAENKDLLLEIDEELKRVFIEHGIDYLL